MIIKFENVKVQPIYNLSEPEVLRAQILEYMNTEVRRNCLKDLWINFLL